jgi:DNA polymerase III delta prime subunit
MNWTEKHRPTDLDGFVDVYGRYRPFVEWVRDWRPGVTERRFAVLYGKPGSGKTSLVVAVASSLGMELHTTNASDERRTGDVQGIWETALARGMSDGRRLIFLDEADHISRQKGRSGGNAQSAVLAMIDASMHPVVMAVNDLYGLDREVRARKPFTLRFDYPDRTEKTVLADRIISREDLAVSVPEREAIVEASLTYRSLIHNLQKASMGIYAFEEDVREEDLFGEFLAVVSGNAPPSSETPRTLFTPDEMIRWMVEYVPTEFGKIYKAGHILGRIRGERSTGDMFSHAWKYSSALLGLCRARTVDVRARTVDGRRLALPMAGDVASRKVKRTVQGDQTPVEERMVFRQRVKAGGRKPAPPPVEARGGGLLDFA